MLIYAHIAGLQGDSRCVGSNIGVGSWSVSMYCMAMYTSANSCVHRTQKVTKILLRG